MENILEILHDTWEIARPFIEIGILTIIIYSCLYFLRGTRGSYILAGITIILIALTAFSEALELEVISWLLTNIWAMFSIAIVVIFQPELRSILAQLGTSSFSSRRVRKKEALNEVVNAVINLSKKSIGALIVFERQIGMRAIINNAITVDARLNRHLIESIFYPNAPLHDGAVIIREDRIIAAHAILPLSQDDALIKTLGTRHRAAIGITEETDAVALTVSEETGTISIAYKGRIRRNIKPEKLLRFLSGLLLTNEQNSLQNVFGQIQEEDEELVTGFDGQSLNVDE